MSRPNDLRQECEQALDSDDQAALARLVARLTPVVQARVARKLLVFRARAASARDIRQEVADLTQEFCLTLFADRGRILRSWVPERGLSLENFVGLIAERQAVSILRSHRRSPLTAEAGLAEGMDGVTGAVAERQAISRDTLARLLKLVRQELSPLGRQIFQLLVVDEVSVGEAMTRTGMSSDALYAWRSRLLRLARRILVEMSEPEPHRRMPSSGTPS